MSHDHEHLVALKGYCSQQCSLVYEYMEGGSLLKVLSNHS